MQPISAAKIVIGTRAHMDVEIYRGFQCQRYVGKFKQSGLQDKADTGYWYTTFIANPLMPQGSGPTPELALRDAANRAQELIVHLKQGLAALNPTQLPVDPIIRTLDPPEHKVVLESADCLDVLIDYHEAQATMAATADGRENCVEYHNERAKQLHKQLDEWYHEWYRRQQELEAM